MKTYGIALSLALLGTTACLSREVDPSKTALASTAVPAVAPLPQRFLAEARIVGVLRPLSVDTSIRIPEVSIVCGPHGGISITPEFMRPGTKQFPEIPTDEQCLGLAEDMLPEGWSLGPPLDEIAKCCFIGGVWVPCHPGWDTRAYPVLRDTERGAQPYSRSMTIAGKDGREQTVEIGFLIVVTAAEESQADPGAGR